MREMVNKFTSRKINSSAVYQSTLSVFTSFFFCFVSFDFHFLLVFFFLRFSFSLWSATRSLDFSFLLNFFSLLLAALFLVRFGVRPWARTQSFSWPKSCLRPEYFVALLKINESVSTRRIQFILLFGFYFIHIFVSFSLFRVRQPAIFSTLSLAVFLFLFPLTILSFRRLRCVHFGWMCWAQVQFSSSAVGCPSSFSHGIGSTIVYTYIKCLSQNPAYVFLMRATKKREVVTCSHTYTHWHGKFTSLFLLPHWTHHWMQSNDLVCSARVHFPSATESLWKCAMTKRFSVDAEQDDFG